MFTFEVFEELCGSLLADLLEGAAQWVVMKVKAIVVS